MTQTFTMAFTAKCAECSVCERSTACNLSAFFIFFIKSQLLPAFYTVAVRVSARRRASRGRWVQQGRFEATLSPRPLTEERKCFFLLLLYVIYRCCMFTCLCVCVSCTRLFFVVRVLTAAIWDIRAVRCPLASSWQTRQEHMPIAGLNWWPHTPPHPVYLRRGRSCVTDLEYLASLNKLRFTRWPMEKQRQRFVLRLTVVPFDTGVVWPVFWPLSTFFFF